MKNIIALSLLCIHSILSYSQNQEEPIFEDLLKDTTTYHNIFELEYQEYAAGHMVGLHFETTLGKKMSFQMRYAMNMARRSNYGAHDIESGNGFGFSYGFRYYTREAMKKLFIGYRADMWLLPIYWETYNGPVLEKSGETELVVIQPTFELGYTYIFNNPHFSVTPSFAAGYEINVITKGEEVGQGAIFLGSLSLGYRFN